MAKTKSNEQVSKPAQRQETTTILPLQVETPKPTVLSYETQDDPLTPEAGKPGLPAETVIEDEGTVDYEDEAAEQEETEIITFSEKDKKDLPLLEQKIETGSRQAFEALREIRQRQLWRLIRNDDDEQSYGTFDDYCEERMGHSRQWVTHATNWLNITEEMERLGITDPPRLTVKAAQGLLAGRLKDAGGLRAVLEEAKQDSVPLKRDDLREIVLRRADYNYWSRDGQEGINKPAAKSYAEYKHDVATAKQLGESGSYALFEEAVKVARDESSQGTGLADALVMISQQKRKMPDRGRLLANFTGVALEELVERLKDVAQEIKGIDEKKTLLANRKKEINSLLQEGGIKKLKDEAKALETELVAVGAITRKAKKDEPPQEDDGRGIPSSDQDEDAHVDSLEHEASPVRTNLTDALASLDLALQCPWPEDSDELHQILLDAQDCEEKLAVIKATVEERLVEVVEPEAMPSGEK
jgi:hypothetical protein